jgi:glutamine amidotransferase
MKACLLDLGLGNLLSIRRGLERAGAEVTVADRDPAGRDNVDVVVLPGVGAFRDGVAALERFGALLGQVREGKKSLLGICLGMQLLFSKSFEGGEYKGLDLIKGEVMLLPKSVKVPQMGWNSISATRDTPLLKGIKDCEFFYFVHSYYCRPEEDVVVADCRYGTMIPAIVKKGNIYGTQFHPEKSGRAGLIFLKNFLEDAKR